MRNIDFNKVSRQDGGGHGGSPLPAPQQGGGHGGSPVPAPQLGGGIGG